MEIETLREIAAGAIFLAGAGGVALSTAVIGAMVEAVVPGWGTRVWVGTCSALSVALRAFLLVAVALVTFAVLAITMLIAAFGLVHGFCVTYLHMYRGGRGHRSRGFGRHGSLGWHRASA